MNLRFVEVLLVLALGKWGDDPGSFSPSLADHFIQKELEFF